MKTTKTILLSILIFLLLGGEKADASNYVKIATIGKGSPVLDKSSTLQEKVDQMIVFWRSELNQVLPDQPDLIVLPEVCDQPAGLSLEEKYQYYKVRGNQFLNFLSSVAKENHFDFAVATINLDYKLVHLDQNWGKLRALKKKYGRDVTIYDPGRIGAVMVTSESKDVSAKDMVEEFEMELLEDYLNRSRTFR